MVGTLMTGSQALADGPGGGVSQCQTDVICVEAHDPGSPGSGSAQGGSRTTTGGKEVCRWYGQEVPCALDDAGWFNAADGCYYRRADPQPAAGDPAWMGHDPSEGGAVYNVLCYPPGSNTVTGAPPRWLAEPPAGDPPPDPAQLAAEAMSEIVFGKPALHTAPGKDGKPLVGMGLWLWYDPAEAVSGDGSKAVRAGGVTVTAKATLQYVEWYMDDSPDPVRCTSPGTPYQAKYGGAESPDCGYRYTTSSADRPGEAFTVSAILHWRIDATIQGAGTHPIPPEDRTSDSQLLQLPVGELQVLN
ncbi:hypothetical protein [Peterkaempfera griseoplana]|uniref:hypothetical protein n=1 Tax=Peterkaempfera griseoplana TaxID=66896 RepID=UPI0012FF58A7|nr:hypothetical protein [Peterkaempfera griseoplana]